MSAVEKAASTLCKQAPWSNALICRLSGAVFTEIERSQMTRLRSKVELVNVFGTSEIHSSISIPLGVHLNIT